MLIYAWLFCLVQGVSRGVNKTHTLKLLSVAWCRAAQCGVGGNPACAGGNSDPVMYGFAGRSFNFMGEVGKIYNIISTQALQVRR